MTRSVRFASLLALAIALVVCAASAAALLAGNVDLAVMFLIVVGAVMVVFAGALVLLKSRDKAWLRDAWLAHNAQPRLGVALTIFYGCGGVIGVIAGVAVLLAGYVAGWVLVLTGSALLVTTAFGVCVGRGPFGDAEQKN